MFQCKNCQTQYSRWQGKCTNCGEWNNLEEIQTKTKKLQNLKDINLIDLTSFQNDPIKLLKTCQPELNRLLGGGLVFGSVILLSGEPGIGKSTLVLEILKELESPALYVSGEESTNQIKHRLDRLRIIPQNFLFLPENNLEKILASIELKKPNLVIIDSIQTLYSSELPSEAGSISQVRIATTKLLEMAKKNEITIVIVGHITKDGQVAGPKALEHLVDVVLYLEGSKTNPYRILRSTKNRFGNTNEVAIFDMTATGLEEIKNPSQIFLNQGYQNFPGRVITSTLEGTRSFLIEIQALVTKTVFGYPQRKTSGFDLNRIQLLAAVLTKRTTTNLTNQDIHLNIVGGLKINEPAADLAVCLSIASSYENKQVPNDMLVLGEIGLAGEVRNISQLETRLKEAEKLEFKQALIPASSQDIKTSLKLNKVKNLTEALEFLK